MTDAERRVANRRHDDTHHWGSRVQVFWRGPKGVEGEAAYGGGQIVLSDDHGHLLTYSREAWTAIIDGWGRLRDREMAEG